MKYKIKITKDSNGKYWAYAYRKWMPMWLIWSSCGIGKTPKEAEERVIYILKQNGEEELERKIINI